MKTFRGFGFTQRADSNASHIVADSKDSKSAKDSKNGALALIEKPLRALKKGEVLVRNLAVALNPVDYKLLDFFGAAQEGQIMGLDGVGVVVESQSEAVEVGGLYAYHADLRCDGSFAEVTILPAKALLPLAGHSACGDFLASASPCSLRRMSNTPHSQSSHSPKNSSAILECQAESSPTDSKEVSESTACHSEQSEESTNHASRDISGYRPQDDKRLESAPHASLEFKADSENPSGEARPLRDKNEIARSADLEASSGWGIVKGEGATSQFKPLPLNKKENTESKEILESQKVKTGDSKAIDSESRRRAESAMAGDSEKRDLEPKHHLAKIASLICPGLTALQCVAKIGEANLRDKSVLVVGAHSSVGRIVSFLCEEAGALVFRVSSTQAGHNLAEAHNEHLESKSRAKPAALDSNTTESSARHLSYTELEARAEELKGQFYAVFDCSGRVDCALLLALIGYYGHFVGVVGRVDSNPLPAFEACVSLHEIALGAIHTHGATQDFVTLQAQASRLFALLDNPRFLQCLPPLKVIPFAQIPTALESLKMQNLGARFVALM